MDCIIDCVEPWILCTCKAVTPNANLHSNIQCTEWPTEPDQAAAPATIPHNREAAVAILINFPLEGPRAAGAAMIIKTPAAVAMGLTPLTAAYEGTNPWAIIAVKRAETASS